MKNKIAYLPSDLQQDYRFTMQKHFKRQFLVLIFSGLFLLPFAAECQLTVGAGLSGMKYLGDGSQRPVAGGLNGNIGIDLSEKSRLILNGAFFVPVTYVYNETLNINNIPTVTKTSEEFKTVSATALVVIDLIGNNKTASLYAAVGPQVMFYNTTVTRDNAMSYNYAGSFKDYVLDARLGLEIPIGLIRIFGEGEIGPAIISDFKNNNVYYKPNKGTMLAAHAGVRIRL